MTAAKEKQMSDEGGRRARSADLRNYTEVLKEVRENQPVYLTRNGRGAYAIVDIEELDRLKATLQLLTKLEEGEQSAREKGWLTADEVEAALGV